MKANALRFALESDGMTALFQVLGRPTLLDSNVLQTTLARLIQEGKTRFVFDLANCPAVDSTFLGTLASLAVKTKAGSACPQVILCRASGLVRKLFDDLGVAPHFQFRDDWPWEGASFAPLPAASEPVDQLAIQKTSLLAHQNLMAANPQNVPKFKLVVDLLARELLEKEHTK